MQNWFVRLANKIRSEDVLKYVATIVSNIPGNWSVVRQNIKHLPNTYRVQYRGELIMYGNNVHEERSLFKVRILYYMRRNSLDVPRELDYNIDASNQWISQNTVPVNTFNSNTGHVLIHFHCYLSGYSPTMNWQNRYQVDYDDQRLVQLANTREVFDDSLTVKVPSTDLNTPRDVAQWIENQIEKAYRFDNGTDEDDNTDNEPYDPRSPIPTETQDRRPVPV